MYTGILDVSHWEFDSLKGKLAPALAAAKAAGIGAVIAKATQGKDYVDPTWPMWAAAIREAGLLLGAYHFNSNSSPGDQQADWFLKAVDGVADLRTTLLCLDYESNPNPAHTMTQSDARAFVHRVHARTERLTGRHPMIYGDSSFLSQFNVAGDLIGEFPLWIAAYGPSVPKLPRAWTGYTMPGYSLFQYTNGTDGPADQTTWPRKTPGFGACDRSAFRGTFNDLRTQIWPGGSR